MRTRALYDSSKDIIAQQFGTITKFRANNKIDLDYDTYRHKLTKI